MDFRCYFRKISIIKNMAQYMHHIPIYKNGKYYGFNQLFSGFTIKHALLYAISKVMQVCP